MPVLIGGKFRLGRKLGSGSFGSVYAGKGVATGEEVAIKLESADGLAPKLLLAEAKVCKAVRGGGGSGAAGIPRVWWRGVEGGYNVMVMDRLGPDLEQLFNRCGRRFSLKTVLMLSEQLLGLLERCHAKNFVHRDVKPANSLMGRGDDSGDRVHVVDFGLAKLYRDPATRQHMPYRAGRRLVGTGRYASINTHVGVEPSRRDDLESLG